MPSPSRRESISTKRTAIAELASYEPKMALKSLNHHVDVEWLREAYRQIRKDGAPGVDGVTRPEYEQNLTGNLESLLDRFKSGLYRAPAVRRVHIAKGQGKTRPIGIPTLEDKILQRAVLMLLEPIYEQDFLDCSYGCRPGRNQHQALSELWHGIMKMGGGWVIDLDIQGFFDAIDRSHLRTFLDQRVHDGVVRRALGKWMRAGVQEEGVLWHPETGTPQGGVISPLLANLYLHEVLDLWFEEEVKPRLNGAAFMVRFVDDVILTFKSEGDARKVLKVLGKRLAKYGLTLHPEKTRLVEFRRPWDRSDGGRGSFEFLGFKHYWGRGKKGNWVLKQITASSRFSRALARVNRRCRWIRHLPVTVQRTILNRMLRGHYNYYGRRYNARAISRFHRKAEHCWRYWLNRRSQKRSMPWNRFNRLLTRHPLLPPTTVPNHA